ncbi:MAG: NAD(P)(+) transhydrogenase (Re/Si-specific) subunit beta, partial [Candidatus Eiseniibacteriota bacterium]
MISMPVFLPISYLIASILFIIGLKRLSSPAEARSGNLVAAVGMALAVIVTLMAPHLEHRGLMLIALAIGGIAGVVGARRVPMTDMPQMVALLNGLGGGAAAVVSTVEYLQVSQHAFVHAHAASPTGMLGVIIGSISFMGSIVAFAKLQGLVSEKAVTSGALRFLNMGLGAMIVLCVGVLSAGGGEGWYFALLGAALAFGGGMVAPIGGADMPVVISLLNSFTGLAAAATGFTLDNTALIISGTLVGASGTLLTQLMCKAMNRSLANVLFGGFGAAPAAGAKGAASATHKPVREISPGDAAVLMGNVREVIIIPGYGMAVAQAQHSVREFAELLAKRGVEVKYAIHPVAGRMPGHMNVLLAEANVPYTQLFDLEAINSEFERADVALVIGANDVVNPSARSDKSSPIYGMPILDADKAQHTIIIK